MQSARALLCLGISFLATTQAFAHHSGAAFDADREIRIVGTVSRFDWKNPHVYIYVDAVGDSGEPVTWEVETDWTTDLIRVGWTADSLSAGDRVTFRANPSRNVRRRYANLISLEKSDGTTLVSADLGAPARARTEASATTIQGRWIPVRGFPGFFQSSAEQVNERGREAETEFRQEENPGNDCIPHPLPTRLGMPHVNDIEVLQDRVIIASESDSEPRTIFTDGREAPMNVEPTVRGYSIGVWDGNVLVVDTTGFMEHRRGNGSYIPSGTRKRLTERYALTEDGTRIVLEYRLEDTDYLVAPVTGTFEWQHAPNAELIPYSCDLEVARRHLDSP